MTEEERVEYEAGYNSAIAGVPRILGHHLDSWYEAGYANGQCARSAREAQVEERFAEVRAKNPRMRRGRPVGIVHSGGQRTVYNCALCGEDHTCATRHRDVKHVSYFQWFHNLGKCVLGDI